MGLGGPEPTEVSRADRGDGAAHDLRGLVGQGIDQSPVEVQTLGAGLDGEHGHMPGVVGHGSGAGDRRRGPAGVKLSA